VQKQKQLPKRQHLNLELLKKVRCLKFLEVKFLESLGMSAIVVGVVSILSTIRLLAMTVASLKTVAPAVSPAINVIDHG
jgi:hypothetical protein